MSFPLSPASVAPRAPQPLVRWTLVAPAMPAAPVAPARAVANSPAGGSAAFDIANVPQDVLGVHMTQYRSLLLPDGPAFGNANCGPASAVMGVRLLGLDLPGFSGEHSERVIDAARLIATGANDASVGTTKTQQAKIVTAAGAKFHATRDLDEALDAVAHGQVALVGGDFNAAGWRQLFGRPDVAPGPAAHAIVVSHYDAATNAYWVNDPLMTAPHAVSRAQLASFAGAATGSVIASPALVLRRVSDTA